MINIGILGIQGAFQKHRDILDKLAVNTVIVKYPQQFNDIDGLILPGGESTVLTRQFGFKISFEDILDFSKKHAVFGTCAGMILMAKNLHDPKVKQLEILNLEIERNAYGPQTESFEAPVKLEKEAEPFNAIFIRAPKITRMDPTMTVLGNYRNEPVWVENERHMATTFHPELTGDDRIHRHFITKIQEQQ